MSAGGHLYFLDTSNRIFMRKRAAKTPLKMPILAGVVIAHRGVARTYLKGAYVLDKRQSRQVHQLFVDSARYTGHEPPKKFELMAGAIFYEDGKIAELWMGGAPGPIRIDWMLHPFRFRSKGTGPEFDVTADYNLLFPPEDRNRTYVAAQGIGKLIVLAWNVESNVASQDPESIATDQRFIRIREPYDLSESRSDELLQLNRAINYSDYIVMAANEMKEMLTRLRYGGGGVNDVSHERAFRHAFKPLLKQRIGDMAEGVLARRRLSIKRLSRRDLQRELLAAVMRVAREYLRIRPGPAYGSKTKKRTMDVEKIDRIHEEKVQRGEKILSAIKLVYKKFRRKKIQGKECQPAEAEAKVTQALVAERLKMKHPSNLCYWLKKLELDFDALKTEAIIRAEEEIKRSKN